MEEVELLPLLKLIRPVAEDSLVIHRQQGVLAQGFLVEEELLLPPREEDYLGALPQVPQPQGLGDYLVEEVQQLTQLLPLQDKLAYSEEVGLPLEQEPIRLAEEDFLEIHLLQVSLKIQQITLKI